MLGIRSSGGPSGVRAHAKIPTEQRLTKLKRSQKNGTAVILIARVKGQLTGLTPLRNIRMEFAVEALYFLLQAH
jgi:hypothetical protein